MSVTSGTFSMSVDEKTKTFVAFAEGLFDFEKGTQFCEAFMSTARGIANQNEYTLIVDVKDVKPSSPQVQEALSSAMALYATDDFTFKKRFMTKLSSAIAQSQVVRLSKSIPGFDQKISFVDTKEEALSKI